MCEEDAIILLTKMEGHEGLSQKVSAIQATAHPSSEQPGRKPSTSSGAILCNSWTHITPVTALDEDNCPTRSSLNKIAKGHCVRH